MVNCVAIGCHNKSDKRKGKKISFFNFPRDQSKRNASITSLKREGYKWKSGHKVCSNHFTKDQYEVDPEWRAQHGYPKAQPRLKSDAIPSFEFPNTTKKAPKKKRGAYLKRRKQEILDEALLNHSVQVDCREELTGSEIDDEYDPIDNTIEEATTSTSFCNTIRTQFSPECMPRSTQVKPEIKSKGSQATQMKAEVGCQTKPETVDIAVQTDESCLTELCMSKDSPKDAPEETMDWDSLNYDDHCDDPDYEPDLNEIVGEELTIQEDEDVSPVNENKYLVSHSSLLKLFKNCNENGCRYPVNPQCKTKGTMLIVNTECPGGDCVSWSSRPNHEGLAWGNLSVAAAILFSGSSYKKMATFFNHIKVPFICSTTYYKIQRSYLIPVVLEYWQGWQDVYLDMLQGTEITVAGDGRCDSPGHCAKYCSYSLMDVQNNKILDTQIVQSNEVPSPCHMELAGLKRCMGTVESKGVDISKLVTDRHSQVKKYMREDHPDKAHDFDVWHVAKGTEKKLLVVAQRSNGAEIKPWISSIKNHMYWVAMTSGDNGPLKRAKWLSVLYHITDQHTGHSDIFPACSHKELEEERTWITKDSVHYQLLEPVINSNYLLTDIEKLSPFYQTYGLEVFHRVILSLAPKTLHYLYWGMSARTYLAAIHYNENNENVQAETKEGEARYAQCIQRKVEETE